MRWTWTLVLALSFCLAAPLAAQTTQPATAPAAAQGEKAKPADPAKPSTDKASQDKAAAEKKAEDDRKAATEKAMAERAAADKAAADKAAAEKAVADKKAADEKAAAEKVAADKLAADKKAADAKTAPAPTTQPALAAAEPTTKPAIAAAEPTTQPALAAEPTTKPAGPALAVAEPKPEPATRPATTFLFQFSGAPYHEVIRKFAQACKKPLLGEVEIPGTLTFFDSEPYAYNEALDTLNILLNMRGFAVIEFGRYLRVVQVAEMANNAKIIKGMDETAGLRKEEVVSVMLPVSNLDPELASKAIIRMVSSYGSISPMGRGKGILITDRLSAIKRVQEMLKILDADKAAESDLKTIQVSKASAKSVAAVVNQVMGGSGSGSSSGSSSSRASGDTVAAFSDDRTNMIFLRGSGPKLAMAEQLIKQLDNPAVSDVSDMRLIELKNARAEDVAKTISEIMPRDMVEVAAPPPPGSSEGRRYYQPVAVAKGRVVAEPETNRLIVSAPLEIMTKILSLIEKLDVASDTTGGVKVFRLKTADAAQLAPIVASAVAKQQPRTPAAGRKGSVTVTGDSRTNSLVVVGPAGDIQAAGKLIDELDRPLDKEEERVVKVIQLPVGSAEKLASALSRLLESSRGYGERYGSSSSGSRSRTAPRIEPDSGTNSLLISAAPNDWPMIDSILKQILPPAPSTPAPSLTLTTPVLKIVPLKFAKCDEMATTLLSMCASRRRSEAVQVIITPSARTNSLLISAADPDQKAIAELIAALDVDSTEKLDPVRVIELKVADAAKVAEAIRTMLPPQLDRRGLAREISMHADPASNTLFIRASDAEQKLIDELVAKMDKAITDPGIIRETRILPLKFVAAAQMAATVTQFFQTGGSAAPAGGSSYYSGSSSSYGYRRRSYMSGGSAGGRADDAVVVAPAPGDQALIIEGPKKKVDEIAAFVARLDTQETGGKLIIRIYQPKKADASDLARTVGATFAKQWADQKRRDPKLADPEPSFEVDSASNQIIIAATEKQLTEIEALLGKLEDVPPVASQMQTFILKNAKADELANVLQTMLGGGSSASSAYEYSSRRRPRVSEGEVRIAAIPGANSLIIQAPPNKMAVAADLIKHMDTGTVNPSHVVIIPLKNASASTLAVTLKALLPPSRGEERDELVIQPDMTTNSLLIRAPADKRTTIEELIGKLDKDDVASAREMRVVPVDFVSAAQIAQTVSQVFRSQGSPAVSGYRRYRSYDSEAAPAGSGGGDELLVTAAPNDRSVIVDAPKKKIESIIQLIQTLDVPEGSGKDFQVHTYQLKNANASDAVRILTNMYADRPTRRTRYGGDAPAQPGVRFDYDASTNQLVVAAPEDQYAEIEAMIKKLDETPAVALASQTRTFPLQFARASEIVPLLTNLLSDTPTPAAGEGYAYASRRRYGGAAAAGEVRLAVMPGTNSIIVQGPPPKLTQAEQLIKTFDTKEAAGSSLVTVLPLKNASAATLAETLRTMLPPSTRGRPEEIVIQADSLTNSLLIRAPEDQRKIIDELIAKLDTGLVDNAQAREMRIIQVKHLSAAQLAETVGVMYQQLREARRGLKARPIDPAEQVVITPSPNDRSIVVEAPKKKVEEIAKLVADLDTAENSFEIVIRTYQLKNANASELARSLTSMFAAKTAAASGSAPRRRYGEEALPAGRNGRAGPQPTFDVDSANNQLLVAATAEQLTEIEQLIQKMDNPEVQAIQTKIFAIKHAKADELVTLLQQMLSEAPPVASPYGETGYSRRRYRSPAGAGGEDIRISTLPGTNSIVVQAPPNKLTKAEQLIQSFDTPEAAVASTVTIIPIKNASATTLVETLRAMLPPVKGRAEEVFIQSDVLTNSLLIRAPETQRKMVQDLIAKLDTPSELAREMKIIPLKFTSATQLAATLQVMYQQQINTVRAGPRAKPVDPAEQVIFTPSPHDQALVVEAPKKKVEEIVKLIAELDVEENPDRLQVRTYQLAENSDAAEMARTLGRLFLDARAARRGLAAPAAAEQQARFEADTVGNQILIAATNKQFEEIEPLLKKLQASATLAVRSKTYQLKFAKASDIAPMLESMLAGSGGRVRSSVYAEPAAPAGEVRVAAIHGNNSIVVQGPPAKLAMADELIKTFDTNEASPRTSIQIVKLKNSQAASLAAAVNATLAFQASTPRRTRYADPAPTADEGKVVVTPEPNSNSLLVRGPLVELPPVLEMIRSLDEGGTAGSSELRIFPVKNCDASELTDTIGKLVQGMIAQQFPRGGDVTPPAFTIGADTRTNSLLVSTTKSYFAIVEQVLQSLDKEQPRIDVQYISLSNATAKDVAEKVNALFVDRKGADKPVVEADDLSNTLTVIAKGVDLLSIQEMVEKLDKGRRELQVRVVPIKTVRADRMAEIIQRVYGQTTSSRVVITDRAPARVGADVPPGTPQPTPAPNPPRPTAPPAAPRPWTTGVVFLPASGPAGAQPASQPYTLRVGSSGTQPAMPATVPATLPAVEPSDEEHPPITIAIDSKSNSLIISAPPNEMENIQSLIDQLAKNPEDDSEAEFRTYRIEHADPVVLAQTLEEMFNPKPKVVYLRTSEYSPPPPPPPPPSITVQADARTRSIVVRAKIIDFDMIEPLIKYLDQETAATSELRVFPLQNTEAGEIADNLKELFNLAKQQQPEPPAAPVAPGQSPQGRRSQRVRQVMDLQIAGMAGGGAKVDPYSAINISANRNTNSVIVSAPKEVMKLVESIVKELDQSAALSKVVIKMYPLQHAEVVSTVTALREILAQPARGGTVGTYRPGSRSGTASLLPGASLRDAPIVVTGDEAGRQIIVSAPATQQEMVAKIIEDIDKASGAGNVLVQVYHIQNADAVGVANSISAMFAGGSSGSAGMSRRVRAATGGAGPRISADASSNCIVARAAKEDHVEIARLIEELDVSLASQFPVRRIPIKNASPTALAANLRAVFSGRGVTPGAGGRRGSGGGSAGSLRDGLVIQPDEDARMLLVRTDEETFKKIQEMVDALDAVSSTDKLQTVIIPLERAQAGSVAAALSQAFGGSAGRGAGGRRVGGTGNPEDEVRIVAEAFTNSIVVTANEKNLAKVQTMVKQFEADTAGGVKTESLILVNAKADELAAVLSRVAGSIGGGRGARAGGVPAGGGGVVVAADAASNSLIFSGPAAEVARLSTMARNLDASAEGAAAQVYMIQLKNNVASEVASAIQQLYAQQAQRRAQGAAREPLSVTFDDAANVVVLSTTKNLYTQISQWVTKFEELKVSRDAPRIIALQFADAVEVERALKQMFAGGAAALPGGRGQTGRNVKTSGKVEIASLPQQQSLLVKAGEEDFKLISDLVKSLDTTANTVQHKPTHVVLKHAPAASVAAALTSSFQQARAGGRGGSAGVRGDDQVRVVAETASNSVIVTANEKNTAAVLSLIAKLDVDEASGKSQFVILKRAKAVELARVLTQASAGKARKAGQQPLVIAADAASNALIFTGPPNDMEAAIAMAGKLDDAATNGVSEVFLIPLKGGQASEVAGTVQQIYQQQVAATRQTGRSIDPLAVSADDSANVLILATTAAMHDQVSQWIAKVEQMKVGTEMPHLVTLENADVAEVERAVRAIFITGRVAGGARAPRGAVGAAGAGSRVEIATLPQQRALLVKASADDFKAIQELILSLDLAAMGVRNQQTLIVLKHAPASSVASALTAAFGPQGARSRGVTLKPEDEVRVIAEPVSNTVIVVANDKNTELVKGLVAKLDVDEASGKSQFVILKKAKAVELAKVLSAVSAGKGGARKPGQQPLVISADAASNAIVLSGPVHEMDAVIQMAAKLDDAAVVDTGEMFLLPLKNGDAAEAAAMVQQLYTQQAAAARTAGRSVDPLAVTADATANVVVLSTTKAMFQQVSQWVQKVEEMKVGAEVPHLVTLENADVSEVERAVRATFITARAAAPGARAPRGAVGATAGGSRIEIATLPAQRAMLVKASADDFKAIQELILSLDKAALGTQNKPTIIVLKHAQATSVGPALQSAFQQQAQARGRGVAVKPEDEVRVVAEAISNTLIVTASEKNVALVQGLVTKLDTEDASGKAQFVILKKAKAVELAKVLTAVTASKTRKVGQQPLVIAADAASNALVMSGSASEMDAAVKMAQELDEAATESLTQVFLVALKSGQASDVAATVQQMYQQQTAAARAAGRSIDPLAVSADDSANVLILATTKALHEQVSQWVQKVEEMKLGQDSPRMITLENADVTEVEKAIRQVFVAGKVGKTGKTIGKIELAALPQQRALLVKAGDEDFKAIHELVLSLDIAAMSAQHKQTLITLKHATASSVAAALTSAFGPQAVRARGGASPLKPEDEVRVIAEPVSNTVIVVASEKNTALVQGLVTKLDIDEASGKSQFVILKKAKAVELARVLTAANAGKPKRPGQQSLTIAADAASNALILTGPPNEMEATLQMAAKLDDSAVLDTGEMFLLPLKNGDAAEAAAMVQQLYTQQAAAARAAGRSIDPLAVTADSSANVVVLSTTKAMHEQVSQWVQKVEELKLGREKPHLVRLLKADCVEVERAIRAAFLSPARTAAMPGGRGGRAPVAGVTGSGKIELVSLPGQQAILVKACEEDCKAIDELVKLLDIEPVTDRAERTVIPLQHATATTVAAALQQAMTPPKGTTLTPDQEVKISAEPNSNFLIVTASRENQAKVKALLEKIDVDTMGSKVEFLLLRQAKAIDLVAVLQTAVARRPKAGAQQVAIAAEPSSNAVVISGPANEVADLAKMVQKLDLAAIRADSRVFILPLANGDADSVSLMIQRLYQQQSAAATRERKSIDSLAVSSDPRANAIILATTPAMFQEVSQWVRQIEDMKPARGNLKLIVLEHADPGEVDKAIQQLFENKPVLTPRGAKAPRGATGAAAPANGSSGGKVETTVLPQQKAILMSANDEDFKVIQELVKALDAAAAGQKRQLQLFTLKKANNARLATALTQMFAAVRAAARPEDQVTVTAVAQTNAIVVAANKERMAEVKVLIEQLDQDNVSQPLEFRVYPLANAMPSKILPALTQLLTQIKANRPDEVVNVTADERTRSIIVTARGTTFDEVEKVIKTLDKPVVWGAAGTGIDVMVYPLKKADAPRLATVLNGMLRPAAANQISPEARELQEQIRLLRVRGGLAEPLPELDLNKPIKIFSDPEQSGQQGSNSLIITSTADNLKAMRAVVELLDCVPLADDVRVRICRLKAADATSVMTVLKGLFDAAAAEHTGRPKSSVAGRGEPESVSGKALTGPLVMSADVRTNTLILTGREETLALAELVVKDLDQVEGKIITEVRTFRLKHADASRILPMLTATFAETAAPVAGSEGLRTQVTRLRTVLQKGPNGTVFEEGHTSELPKTRLPLSIQADAATNILLVAARSDVMPLIADVINSLDVAGAGTMNLVRIFPLENADAARLQTVIAGLYTGPSAALVRPEDKPNVAVDTRTNALIICASEQTFAMVETLIKRLDAKLPVDVREIQAIPLKNADADTTAATLQKMMDNRVQRQTLLGVKDAESLRMVILADERSNSLLVGGSAEGFKLVKDLAEQLDGASPALAGQVHLMPLKEANPGTLSVTLSTLFQQRYATARTPDLQRQKPILLPDYRVNALLVVANADDYKILQGLLEKMDVKMTDPAVQIYVVPLRHNDAASVGTTIRTIFAARTASLAGPGQTASAQDRVEVAIDALSNALIVSASKENYGLLVDLLKKVDVEPPMESGLVRMYPLANADAARVAALLQSLVQQGVYRPGMAGATATPALAAREKVSIVVDSRMNLLVVSASKENFVVIDELIRKLDGSREAAEDMRVYTLKNADAVRLAATLQQLFAARQAGAGAVAAARTSTTFVPDSRTNTLIVTGSRESFGTVEDMIRKLDGEKGSPASEFKIFQLRQATATAIQPTVQQLFAQRVTRGTTKDPVTVLADARSNSLIVNATLEDMAIAESLISRLDVPATAEGKTHMFPLVKADATQVANTIRNLFQGAAGGAAGAAAAGVGISVDERINALIVSAGEADLKRIKELVEQLDSETVTKVTEIRVFTLRHADATELATIITDAMTNKPKAVTPGSPNRQTLLQFVGKTREGKDLQASALQEGILITPDRRTNSLVVSAPIQNMPLLDSLIQALDSTGEQMAEIRLFALQNADCRAMATVLQELFRLQASAASGNLRTVNYTMAASQPADGAAPGAAQAPATLGTAESAQLNVTVDARTNSLLVSGCRQYVGLCSQVIEALDASPAQERQTRIYRLRNAKAADIQTALRAFLDQERQKVVQMLGQQAAGSAQRLLEHEIAVVAEATSNTLLLSASPRYFQVVSTIIDELDQPQPQVLIQTLLAEVTLDNTRDLGFDFKYNNTFHDQRIRTNADGTQSLVREVDRVVSSGTDFGTKGAIEKFGGFSVAVTGGDISLFLRALQSEGRVEILSRPQILASDNQQALINVGQRVPFVTNTRISDQGSVFNTITYQDVGIILRVTPRINPDGFVKLDVNPEISSLSTSSVQISEGLNAPVINNRSAQTTVMVQDGHTIVIGGLITTRDENREKKVPFLGDVPVLSYLFRSETKIKERTELLIILTPHVLRTPEDADSVTDKQLKRLNLLRESQKDALKEYLFRPTDTPATQPASGQRAKIISLESPFRGKGLDLDSVFPPTTQPAGGRALPVGIPLTPAPATQPAEQK